MPLHTTDPELRDLASTNPELVDISTRATGLTLRACLGVGGMSTVFLATLDRARRSADLSPFTPDKVVVKLTKPAIVREAERVGMDSSMFSIREIVALGRMAERRPPTEFVVGFYGSGSMAVDSCGRAVVLPWLALELVDGGVDGVTLAERVERSPDGVDPVRALRLLQGIFEGVLALHGEGILHRDIKPENVLVAGPIDDETPKLADYGIARVEGLQGSVAGLTPMYAGPEQCLSMSGYRNPLVGAWTDVHALAAVAWFVLAGEHWCRADPQDSAWQHGLRRSLRSAARIHPALLSAPSLLTSIDIVLARGASHRLPAVAVTNAGAYVETARATFPTLFEGEERFASVDELRAALFPLLMRAAANWQRECARAGRPSTAFRTTEASQVGTQQPMFSVEERSWRDDAHVELSVAREWLEPATPGSVVFQPDNRVLARFGSRLLYFIGDRPLKVAVPEAHRDTVSASRWLLRGPAGGFALVGSQHVLLIRGARFIRMPLPERPGGGEVGEIQAAVGSSGVFGVVTAETEDANGGPELWTSTEGDAWEGPTVLPLRGDVHSISHGPYGHLVVGSRKGKQGRALLLPFDAHSLVYGGAVNEAPPLLVAQCGAAKDAWAAGEGFALALGHGRVVKEAVESNHAPAAMGLDLTGNPWLVTERAVLRREIEAGAGVWRAHYHRDGGRAPLVAIGFAKDEVRVLDAYGDSVCLFGKGRDRA